MTDTPQTVAELAIVQSRAGVIAPQAVLWAMAASILAVPTTDATTDGALDTFSPLLVGRDGQEFLVVFTVPERIGRFRDRAAAFIEMPGADVVRRMPPGIGLVVNPETTVGFEVPGEGVAAFRAELAAPSG
jgi:hypothetical protein